jgi:hypothetical protein
MMPHALGTDSRRLLERWAFQHFKNEVWDTVRDHDPFTLSETTIQQIEHAVLSEAQNLVLRLPLKFLQDPRHMNIMIGDSMSETRDGLRKAAAWQSWEQQRRARR